jgi:hypothetical protein
VVARLKEESEGPLRSHGSLSMNRALMAAGLVDRVQVTLLPVITGQTGADPTFQGVADFDLELIESRALDGHGSPQAKRSSNGPPCTADAESRWPAMRSASGPAAGLRDLAGPGLGGLVADLFDDELDAVASRLDEAGLLARADSGADRGGSSQCGDGSHGGQGKR